MNIDTDAKFDGDDYQHDRDFDRLKGQILDIYQVIRNGHWYTLSGLAKITKHPEASISAQLRNLRKPKFGGYTILSEHIGHGLYKYKLDLTAEKITYVPPVKSKENSADEMDKAVLKEFIGNVQTYTNCRVRKGDFVYMAIMRLAGV